ncbi:MAG: 50S ribosome-binding GTPase, partial [Deltaproteobacteria bacterium]|nr:50S ribosome-binding GTPase [Deltaproteobacteria bacterium]
LVPNLGVVKTDWGEPFVVADIPGLIEGAHKGAGLGIRFLRHIERTRILIHLIDLSSIDPADPLKSYKTINKELGMYNKELAKKFQIVVLNKIDIPGAKNVADIFQASLSGIETTLISALAGQGIDNLKSKIVQSLDNLAL